MGLVAASFAGSHPAIGLYMLALSIIGACWSESPLGGVVLAGTIIFAIGFFGVGPGLVALGIFLAIVAWGVKG